MVSNDTLCSGRFGLQAGSEVCAQRMDCRRFRQLLVAGDKPVTVPVHVILRDSNRAKCQHFKEMDDAKAEP